MKTLNTQRSLGYPMTEVICVSPVGLAPWHQSALSERGKRRIQVQTTALITDAYNSIAPSAHVRRT